MHLLNADCSAAEPNRRKRRRTACLRWVCEATTNSSNRLDTLRNSKREKKKEAGVIPRTLHNAASACPFPRRAPRRCENQTRSEKLSPSAFCRPHNRSAVCFYTRGAQCPVTCPATLFVSFVAFSPSLSDSGRRAKGTAGRDIHFPLWWSACCRTHR